MDNISILYHIYSNLFELFTYRGYTASSIRKESADFNSYIRQHKFIVMDSTAAGSNKTLSIILFLDQFGASVTEFKKVVKSLPARDNYLFVLQDAPSSHVTKYISSLSDAARYEIYPQKLFVFVVPKHALTPKQEIVSKNDMEEWLKTWKLMPERLSKIKSTDAAAVWIGARAGDFVKITRFSKTSGTSIAYRYCV